MVGTLDDDLCDKIMDKLLEPIPEKLGKGRPNIVVPTIRDEEFFLTFLTNWCTEFSGCHLIVVEDRQEKELASLIHAFSEEYNFTYAVYDWGDIDEDLKEDAWIISRQTDCVRNYGYLDAYRNNPLFIVTLDDDIEPYEEGHIQQFYNNLFTNVEQSLDYFSTMNNVLPRGALREYCYQVVVSHGGWLNVPDFDAKTQIEHKGKFFAIPPDFYQGVVPKGCYYSMCGMNLAWRPEWTKYMYFPLMGAKGGYPIDRCGDIWAGYYSKHKADQENEMHYTGKPFCVHNRASNPWTNLIKEEDSELMGELFLDCIVKGKNENRCEPEYFNKVKEAYVIWERLINEVDSNEMDNS